MADHVLDDSPAPDDPLDRPEPVLDEARIIAGISGALPLLGGIAIAAGWITKDESDTLTAGLIGATGAVIGFINVAVAFWRAKKARTRVTPLASPRSASGEPLVALAAVPSIASAAEARQPLPTGEPEPTPWQAETNVVEVAQ